MCAFRWNLLVFAHLYLLALEKYQIKFRWFFYSEIAQYICAYKRILRRNSKLYRRKSDNGANTDISGQPLQMYSLVFPCTHTHAHTLCEKREKRIQIMEAFITKLVGGRMANKRAVHKRFSVLPNALFVFSKQTELRHVCEFAEYNSVGVRLLFNAINTHLVSFIF